MRGEIQVEQLREGDEVRTGDGTQPIVWICQRRVDLLKHPHPKHARPIKIRRHAFAQTTPARDLLVSPDHAISHDGQRKGRFDLAINAKLPLLCREGQDTRSRARQLRSRAIVRNELYVGKLVWNRLRYIKDPATGKRVSRINPREKWITTEMPELRIIDEPLWQAAKARQGELAAKYANVITAIRAALANRLNGTHRPRSLLSGLLVCGCCGGPYSLHGQDRYACSNDVMNGSCINSRSITRAALEARMLDGLRERLMAPEVAAEAMRAYTDETNRLNRERRAGGDADRKALADVEKTIKEILTVITDGGYSRPLMAHLRELEAKQHELSERRSRASVDIPDIHPNVAGIYRRKVERLAQALQHPQERDGAADAIRALINDITLAPRAKRGEIAATLHGDLGTILN